MFPKQYFTRRLPIEIAKKWLSKAFWTEPDPQSLVLYLTFDDGPIPEVTPWVLEQLKLYNAKATFFCLGKNVERYPAIYKNIIDAGHLTGNHTFDHKNGWFTANQTYFKDCEKADAVFKTTFFRPPYGKLKPSQWLYLKKKYKIVFWNVLSRDYDQHLTPMQIVDNVINFAQNGDIIVFHDSYKAQKNLQIALPAVLAHYAALGYAFKTLE